MNNIHKSEKSTNETTRNAWLEKVLSGIPRGSKLLDAGAGELQFKKFCSHLNYTSQDFGQYNGQGNNEGKQTKTWDNSKLDIISDITSIPVADNSFDALMCIEVLEHVPKPIDAIKEFFRILKPGGKLVITAPFSSLTHFAPYYFYNGYSKYWYEKILRENNFAITEICNNGNYFEYLHQEIKRMSVVENKYTKLNISKKIVNKIGIKIVSRLLNKLSQNNNGSEELLCFGLHVLATKI